MRKRHFDINPKDNSSIETLYDNYFAAVKTRIVRNKNGEIQYTIDYTDYAYAEHENGAINGYPSKAIYKAPDGHIIKTEFLNESGEVEKVVKS